MSEILLREVNTLHTKKWCMAMLDSDKECDMAGVTALHILIGVSLIYV